MLSLSHHLNHPVLSQFRDYNCMNHVVHVIVDDDVDVAVLVDDVVVVVAAAAVDAVVELVVMSHDVALHFYHSLIV